MAKRRFMLTMAAVNRCCSKTLRALGRHPPARARTRITPPAADHVRSLLAAAEEHDPVQACWLQVALATGARRGEVCALRWSDADLAAATVRIERSAKGALSARASPAGRRGA